jgi:hypothetical protein
VSAEIESFEIFSLSLLLLPRLWLQAEVKSIMRMNRFFNPDILGFLFTIRYGLQVYSNLRNIIFMPHVTMCTPSPRPGAGFVDPELWKDKEANREIPHREFD